jgi:hypothetical protein
MGFAPLTSDGKVRPTANRGDTNMDANPVPKTIRQLRSAEGYIELGLAERALNVLDAIEVAEPFEAAVALLRGEALKVQHRYCEAVEPLKRAATMIPAPLNRRAWVALSECYRGSGRDELADIVDLVARADVPAAAAPTLLRIAVVPISMVPDALRALVEDLASQAESEPGGIELEPDEEADES